MSSVKKSFTWTYFISRHAVGGFVNDNSGTELKPNAHYVNIHCKNGYRPPYPGAACTHSRVWIRASRLIFPGEKIIIDYGPSYDDYADMTPVTVTTELVEHQQEQLIEPRLPPLGSFKERPTCMHLSARGYAVEGLLGKGGYGKQIKTCKGGEYFAVKVPARPDRKLAASIKVEGEILKNLNHPNIIQACELNVLSATSVNLITRYQVSHIIFEDRTMVVTPTRSFVQQYMSGLLRALEYLHGRGIVHRDVKIESYLFDCVAMHGVLIDFGMATRMLTAGPVGVDEEGFPAMNLQTRKRTAAAAFNQQGQIEGSAAMIWKGGTQGYQSP